MARQQIAQLGGDDRARRAVAVASDGEIRRRDGAERQLAREELRAGLLRGEASGQVSDASCALTAVR